MERLTVSVEEAAQALGVSRAHAFRMVNSGELPARRLGKRWLVSIATLKELAGTKELVARSA